MKAHYKHKSLKTFLIEQSRLTTAAHGLVSPSLEANSLMKKILHRQLGPLRGSSSP